MKYFDSLKDKLSSLWSMWLVIILAALWSIYIQDGQINRDGLLYLKQAYLIAEGSWRDDVAKIIKTGYQLEKSFAQNQQGVYILKRINSD